MTTILCRLGDSVSFARYRHQFLWHSFLLTTSLLSSISFCALFLSLSASVFRCLFICFYNILTMHTVIMFLIISTFKYRFILCSDSPLLIRMITGNHSHIVECNKSHYIDQPQVISLTVNKNTYLYKNVYPFIFLQRETLKNVSVKKGKGNFR